MFASLLIKRKKKEKNNAIHVPFFKSSKCNYGVKFSYNELIFIRLFSLMKPSSAVQGINVKSGEQLSSFQLEDLVGMIRNAEKSRISFCYT